MKLSLIIHFVLILSSCTATFAGSSVTLNGKIRNPISDGISVSYSDSWIGYIPITIAARLDKDGNFSLTFPLEHAFDEIFNSHGNQMTELFPEPGDNLEMTLDAKNFDSTIHYTGKGAAEANFIAKHMLFSGMSRQFGALLNHYCKDSADSFIAEINAAMKKEIDFSDANGQQLSPSFKKYWKAFFQYHVYNIMLDYALYHTISQQHSYAVKIPKENYSITSEVTVKFDDDLLHVNTYRYYVGKYYGEQLNAKAAINDKPKIDDAEEVSLSYKNMPPKSAEVYCATNCSW